MTNGKSICCCILAGPPGFWASSRRLQAQLFQILLHLCSRFSELRFQFIEFFLRGPNIELLLFLSGVHVSWKIQVEIVSFDLIVGDSASVLLARLEADICRYD